MKDSDFLIINKDTVVVDFSNEDLQNFHIPVKINDNIYYSKEREYHDISFFLVSRSKNENKENIMEILPKGIKLFSDELVGIDSFKMANDSVSSIVSYVESVPQEKKLKMGNVSFKFNEDQLYYEALSFDYAVSKKKRGILESYLAMKYGVTLSSNYFNAKNDTIWYYNKNEGFRNNILCIGRDEGTGLNQKQATDYRRSFSFGLGSIEKTNYYNKIENLNNHFLFISDNGNVETLKENETLKTKRIWKVNSEQEKAYQNVYNFEFDFNKILETELEENQFIWWVIGDDAAKNEINYTNATYIKADYVEDHKAIFSKKDLSQYGQGFLFSIIKAPDLFAMTETISKDCFSMDLKVRPIGGNGRYNIQLIHESSGDIFTKHSDNADAIFFENMPVGKYNLTVKDSSNKIFLGVVKINEELNNEYTKNSYEYILPNSGSLTLDAKDYIPSDSGEYFWESKKDNKIEYSSSLILDSEGEYVLNYTNASGCKNKITYTITTDNKNLFATSNIVLYPNPVKAQMPFTIAIDLIEKSDVKIKIYSSVGQLVFENQFKDQKSLKFKHSLLISGAYYIVVETGKGTKNFKVLVQ